MASLPASLLERQVQRVNRRLVLSTFLDRCVWVWNRALAVSALWLLVHWLLALTAVTDRPAPWLYYTVAGVVAVAGIVGGAVWTYLRAPSRLTAALSLDQQFDLRERVTTSLTLTPEQRDTPAGQALLRDVDQRIGKLDIPGRFPIRMSWAAALVPAWVFVLVVFALLYDPGQGNATSKDVDPLSLPPVNRNEIARTFNKLKKKPAEQAAAEKPKSEELERIEADLDKIANKPRETREQVRDRIKELTAAEEKVKERQKELGDRNRSIQQQLQELSKPGSTDGQKNDATRDLQKALAENDMNKAQDELEKLTKKLKDDKLSEQQKEEMKKQLDDLKDKLEQLARQDEKKKQLEKMHQEGKIDADTLKRELAQIDKEKENLKDLANLASKLGQMKKAMEKGDQASLEKNAKAAADAMKDMDLSDKEMQDLDQQMERLQDAKNAASKGDKDGKGTKDGKGKGDKGDKGKSSKGRDGDEEGKDGNKGGKDGNGKDGGGEQPGNGQGDTNEPNKGGIGQGKRPLGADKPTNSFEARQRTPFDPKGQKLFDGHADGQNYKAKGGPELMGEIRQASQEAPEALDQQRIPKSARDMAKGYFENLGAQGQKKAKPDEKP